MVLAHALGFELASLQARPTLKQINITWSKVPTGRQVDYLQSITDDLNSGQKSS